jgi:hypothetical protein
MDDERERDADLVLPLDCWRLREARAELTEGIPMPHQRVQFADTIEPLVQFIEETPRDEIIDRTLEKLREGVSTETMLMASTCRPGTMAGRCIRWPGCTRSPRWSGDWRARTGSCRCCNTSRCPTSTCTTR